MTIILIISGCVTNDLWANPSTSSYSSTGGFGSIEVGVATHSTGHFGTAASVAPATRRLIGSSIAKPPGFNKKEKETLTITS